MTWSGACLPLASDLLPEALSPAVTGSDNNSDQEDFNLSLAKTVCLRLARVRTRTHRAP